MITKNMIRDGINEDLIRFIPDPESATGTVCEIGSNWFHFGNYIAENELPEEFLYYEDKDEIVDDIWETLNGFREDESCAETYGYYESYIKGGLNRKIQVSRNQNKLKHCPHCGYIASVQRVTDEESGEDRFKAVCLNEFCIASQNNFLYSTISAAVKGWNYRVSPSTGGFTIDQQTSGETEVPKKKGRPRLEHTK